MTKIRIGIMYGGRSTEHEISIRSAYNVHQYLDRSRFEPVLIGISPAGKWFLMDSVTNAFDKGQPLHLRLDASDAGIFIHDGSKIAVDYFFPVLHGTDGEDGNIQGLLTAMDFAFIGTGVLGSSICMSKLVTKQLLFAAGIPVVPFTYFYKKDREKITFDQLTEELGIPFMAKAANLGSSVGVNKVKSAEDLKHAVDEAFRYDNVIIFEKFIKGRELECSLIGNGDPKATLAAEIVINPKYEFYTYKAKYLDPEAVKLEVPAQIDQEVHQQVQLHSINAYKTLHCEDFSRVDVFLADDGQIFINEINTIPGFTNASMFPMMWKERGLDYPDLLSKIIDLAVERHKVNQKQREYQIIN